MIIPNLILKSLVRNETFTRKVVPHMEKDFFEEPHQRIIFEEIDSHLKTYNTLPTKDEILVSFSKRDDLQANEQLAQSSIELLRQTFKKDEEGENVPSDEWLTNTAEEWCQERAVYNSIIESVSILDGKDYEKRSKHAIPKILQDALSVSFNNDVGHDYLENFAERLDFYRHKEDRIPFDIDLLNKISDGGVPKKSLNIIMAGTGVGKSLMMCHFASSYLMQGKNVVYISMEMSEERIAERIDANLMNVPINKLSSLSDAVFNDRIQTITEKTKGRLIVKEYPTTGAHSGHFRALFNELKTKKDFVPDVIIIDYLNICASSRIKSMGGSINTYTYVKSIAEELRGLAVEFDCPLWTATQSNRSGNNNSDTDITNTSDSFGVPMTADMFLAAVSNDELQERGQMLIVQLKNRYNDPSYYNKFFIGVDRSKMKLYNLEESAQQTTTTTAVNKMPSHTETNIVDSATVSEPDDFDFSQFKF